VVETFIIIVLILSAGGLGYRWGKHDADVDLYSMGLGDSAAHNRRLQALYDELERVHTDHINQCPQFQEGQTDAEQG
jgi:hypothetical protein